MRIVELRWRRYRIPFRQPVATAHGEMPQREGAIVEVVTDEGVTGVGEIAPLPQFGHTLEEALAPLPVLADAVQQEGDVSILWHAISWRPFPAALRFGIETAYADAEGRRVGESLSTIGYSVPVNFTIASASPDEAAAEARRAVSSGFGCVKLKVGVCDSVDAEVKRVAAVRAAIGASAQLRLDANEAWTFAKAVDVLSAVARYDIQYAEQPLARDDLAGMRLLRETVAIPVAADEAVTDEVSLQRVVAAAAADVLILKPQCLGGRLACMRSISTLPSGSRWVVTTAMETGVGVVATLHLAAKSEARLACGLATLDLLEDDLILESPRIENGMVHVPQGPGLGVELDRAALTKYAVG